VSVELPSNCRLHRLDARGDDRGSLIALEGGRSVPFEIARVYYIFGTRPGVARGFHAHRDLKQLAVCVRGSCVMTIDDGRSRREVLLDRPDLALEIGSMVWREMRDFSEDAVLLVLASGHYDSRDYIQSYDEFLAEVRA
jgi:dTDP-4-dehydrorhamnose 3,5-epimerase-like enzyme